MKTGSNLDIDQVAELLTSDTTTFTNGVIVKALSTNSGIVYISTDSSVTAGSAAATDGFPLSAGESVTLPLDRADKLYAIGSADNQKLFYAGF